jgi:anti-sigma regulatory factor (Ser/Thr protein kinase)
VLRVEVRDSGDGWPIVRLPDTEGSDGRGLFLVRELADDFGVTEHVPGKTVWVVFKVATAAGAGTLKGQPAGGGR